MNTLLYIFIPAIPALTLLIFLAGIILTIVGIAIGLWTHSFSSAMWPLIGSGSCFVVSGVAYRTILR